MKKCLSLRRKRYNKYGYPGDRVYILPKLHRRKDVDDPFGYGYFWYFGMKGYVEYYACSDNKFALRKFMYKHRNKGYKYPKQKKWQVGETCREKLGML